MTACIHIFLRIKGYRIVYKYKTHTHIFGPILRSVIRVSNGTPYTCRFNYYIIRKRKQGSIKKKGRTQ